MVVSNSNYIRLLGLLLYLKFHDGWDIIVEGRNYGTYIRDGEEIEIHIVFGHVSNALSIYDSFVLDDNRREAWDVYTYFTGRWEVKDDKLHLTLLPKWREMYGIDKIVFTKIADYE